jgi:hypothetical protein
VDELYKLVNYQGDAFPIRPTSAILIIISEFFLRFDPQPHSTLILTFKNRFRSMIMIDVFVIT